MRENADEPSRQARNTSVFRHLVLALAPRADVARLERALARCRAVVQPKRHVHALHMRDTIGGGEFLREELLAFVVVGKRLFSGRFVQLERDDHIGLRASDERAGRHGLVAAIRALLDGGGGVGGQLRATRRAHVRPHALALLVVPACARKKRRDGVIGLRAHGNGGVDDLVGDHR